MQLRYQYGTLTLRKRKMGPNVLKELEEPYKTMVLTAGCLGLRASETMGLQWDDIDWDNLTVFIRRSATGKHIYETKTEGSSKPVPLDPNLAEVFRGHRDRSPYKGPADFVFAGESGRPRWRGVLFADHIKPAAGRPGIGKIGWHTFRHTFQLWSTAWGRTWLCRRSFCGTPT